MRAAGSRAVVRVRRSRSRNVPFANVPFAEKKKNLAQGVYSFFAFPYVMMKFCKNLDGPCPAPTYLPTYLPYLWETKKEIMGG